MYLSKTCRSDQRSPRLLTFDVPDDDHDEEAVVVGVVSVVDPRCDLAGAHHFLQGHQHQLDGQESHTFVEEVERAVKDKIPGGGGAEEDITGHQWTSVG